MIESRVVNKPDVARVLFSRQEALLGAEHQPSKAGTVDRAEAASRAADWKARSHTSQRNRALR